MKTYGSELNLLCNTSQNYRQTLIACIEAIRLFLSLTLPCTAVAETFPYPTKPEDSLIGEIRYTRSNFNETLLDVARDFDLGHDQILKANPTVNRWVPGEGTLILLPTRYLLPKALRKGIVLNLAEKRVYYFRETPDRKPLDVMTFPVGIGRPGWETPTGQTTVIKKERMPAWYPTPSIRAESEAKGITLPDFIPGGDPRNPLGEYSLRLGIKGCYLIHGSSPEKSAGIGMRVSHGCIRMYPEDIRKLFYEVSIGTQVHIVDQPIKVGWKNHKLYLEVHLPFEEDISTPIPALDTVLKAIAEETAERAIVNAPTVARALNVANGVPTLIGHATESEHRYFGRD